MRELIHPVLGTRRVWNEPHGAIAAAAVEAGAPLQAVTRGGGGVAPMGQQTQATIEQHSMGMLFSPVKPDIARNILEIALSGDLNAQWELFCRMEEWDRLNKCLNEVKNAVKRLRWTVKPYAERGEEASESAQEKADLVSAAMKNWEPRVGTLETSFEGFIYDAMDAMGKGISVQEIHWFQRDGAIMPRAAHLLTPKQYGWNGRGNELGLIGGLSGETPSRTRGTRALPWQEFPENQFAVGIWNARSGVPGATALLRCLVPYWVGITYGWKWLMQTAQLFGVPFRWATYDGDKQLANTIAAMLEAMGSSGYGVFPAGTTLDFKEAVTAARDNPQALIIELSKKACDLLVLGQELSGESEAAGLGSGNALLQGKVRQDVLQHAAAWVSDLLSYQLVLPLLRLNFGETSEAPEVCADFSVDPDPMQMAQRDEILIRSGMRIPSAYMHERHGVPEPEEGEEVITPIQNLGVGVGSFGTEGNEGADDESGTQEGRKELPANGRFMTREELMSYKAANHTQHDCALHAADAATEKLIDNALEQLTGVEAKWLAGIKPHFRKLLVMARDEKVTDADFVKALEAAHDQMPELFGELDMDALAQHLYETMSAAVVNGAVRGFLTRRRAKI